MRLRCHDCLDWRGVRPSTVYDILAACQQKKRGDYTRHRWRWHANHKINGHGERRAWGTGSAQLQRVRAGLVRDWWQPTQATCRRDWRWLSRLQAGEGHQRRSGREFLASRAWHPESAIHLGTAMVLWQAGSVPATLSCALMQESRYRSTWYRVCWLQDSLDALGFFLTINPRGNSRMHVEPNLQLMTDPMTYRSKTKSIQKTSRRLRLQIV
jgi:hypothetical protein